MMQDDDDDDDDNDDPMILNHRAKNHTSERTIVPWTVIFFSFSLSSFSCNFESWDKVTALLVKPRRLGSKSTSDKGPQHSSNSYLSHSAV